MRSDRADDAQSEEEGGDADSLGLLLCDFPLRYLGPSTVAGEREAVTCQTCGGPPVFVRAVTSCAAISWGRGIDPLCTERGDRVLCGHDRFLRARLAAAHGRHDRPRLNRCSKDGSPSPRSFLSSHSWASSGSPSSFSESDF